MPPGCPECESARIEPRARTGDWRCKECRAVFDDAIDVSEGVVRRGLAKTLDAMDPEDLVTDGGVDQIDVCPQCDSSSIRRRSKRYGGATEAPNARWHCRDCDHYFDEPAVRARLSEGETLTGLSAQLASMDPDEVSG